MPNRTSITPFCQRCGGKMEPRRDLYGEYDGCITCGFHRDVVLGPPIELKPPYRSGPKARRHHGPMKAKRSRGPSRGGQSL